MTGPRAQAVLIGGTFIGVLSALPIISLANICCTWVIGGGVVTAYLLQQGQRAPILLSDGAVAGFLAGVCGACIYACAGKARSRGTRCRDVIFETLFETLWVSNPIRPRSAASRNRVMRGPGVPQGAKRSQGARRPRD